MWSSLLALTCLAGLTTAQNTTFKNPILYSDFPDNDVSVGPDGAYYLSASNFHYSPGAPILRSLDLVNWEFIGHSIPRLTFGDDYDLVPGGEREYRGGTWASTLRYRESNGLWYWIGCTNFWNTWVFTAEDVTGPWTKAAQFESGLCYYDLGLLIDDNDDLYVAYASGEVHVAQLAADGLSPIRDENVFNATDAGAADMEGNRMYQINGTYYILNDEPSGGRTFIWKSDSPWGPWEYKVLVDNNTPPLEGGTTPIQGSLVETSEGDWYFMSFTWAYPAGRLPVLAPITWGDDGFPVLVEGGNGGWGAEYPLPLPAEPLGSWKDLSYTFAEETSLPVHFEWNHNPDDESWELTDSGLTLHAASVTDDIYSARNTLTHRTFGEFPDGEAEIDFTNLADGDRFGLAVFRDRSAYLGVHRVGSEYTLTSMYNMTIDEGTGETLELGNEVATELLPEGTTKIWLRAALDTRPTGTTEATFSYSLDGGEWTVFGDSYELYSSWRFFIAYRFGIVNYATTALGGSIDLVSFSAT